MINAIYTLQKKPEKERKTPITALLSLLHPKCLVTDSMRQHTAFIDECSFQAIHHAVLGRMRQNGGKSHLKCQG